MLLSTLIFVACGGPSRGAASTGDSSPATAGGNPASDLQADFSMTLDGVAISGAGVDDMQQQNAAYITPGSGDAGKTLYFYLWATKNGADTKANYSLRLYMPAAQGVHAAKSFTDHSCHCGITLNRDIATSSVTRYGGNAFTITITSMTATRVTGTFSGTFVLSPDTPNSPKTTATITDGKFDIPMGTSKILPS